MQYQLPWPQWADVMVEAHIWTYLWHVAHQLATRPLPWCNNIVVWTHLSVYSPSVLLSATSSTGGSYPYQFLLWMGSVGLAKCLSVSTVLPMQFSDLDMGILWSPNSYGSQPVILYLLSQYLQHFGRMWCLASRTPVCMGLLPSVWLPGVATPATNASAWHIWASWPQLFI